MPAIGTPARLRVQPQPVPLGQIDSIGGDLAEAQAGAQAGRVDLQPRAVHPHLAAARPQRGVGVLRAGRSRSQSTQKDWPSGPTSARAAQSISSSPKTPT